MLSRPKPIIQKWFQVELLKKIWKLNICQRSVFDLWWFIYSMNLMSSETFFALLFEQLKMADFN